MKENKVRFSEIELLTNDNFSNSVLATKMPRTAIIPVVKDKKTNYINAAPYSGGIVSLKPYQVFFGVKSWDSKFTFREADEFVIAVPNRSQIHHMWVMACSVPQGINEIDLAGWTEMKSKEISTPGITECPLNLECKKIALIQLGGFLRDIIIGEVVGISIDTNILNYKRSDVIKQYPMHEATSNPYTGLYGPSVLSGELIPSSKEEQSTNKKPIKEKKVFLGKNEIYKEENQDILINAIFPRPSYILMSMDSNRNVYSLPISGGLLMTNMPSIQIPLPKDSPSYQNIKRIGEFVISIPVRDQIDIFEDLERDIQNPLKKANHNILESSQITTPGLEECQVNIECKVVKLVDILGNNYALLIGEKVGLSVDRKILKFKNMMEYYSQLLYAVMDYRMVRKWGFHDIKNLSVRPLPSWGSRYHGGWWTGPEQYQAGMHFWLFELVQSGYLSEQELFQLRRWLSWWRNEGFMIKEPFRSELKDRLTTVLRMMVWAHRDYHKWHKIHQYLGKFPYSGVWRSP